MIRGTVLNFLPVAAGSAAQAHYEKPSIAVLIETAVIPITLNIARFDDQIPVCGDETGPQEPDF